MSKRYRPIDTQCTICTVCLTPEEQAEIAQAQIEALNLAAYIRRLQE
ncbi:DUF2688 domain-containing protein [Xanthomonas translucens]|nr:DUF2688 domain-containing protein [Xanthomonas translucens]